MNKILTIFIITLTLMGCRKKYEHCDNATVCVKNIGSTKIAYGWNTSAYTDTLNPGQSTCVNVGEYNADPNNQAGSITYFYAQGATWAIKPTSCNTKKEIK